MAEEAAAGDVVDLHTHPFRVFEENGVVAGSPC
jgi:hypothetical protein